MVRRSRCMSMTYREEESDDCLVSRVIRRYLKYTMEMQGVFRFVGYTTEKSNCHHFWTGFHWTLVHITKPLCIFIGGCFVRRRDGGRVTTFVSASPRGYCTRFVQFYRTRTRLSYPEKLLLVSEKPIVNKAQGDQIEDQPIANDQTPTSAHAPHLCDLLFDRGRSCGGRGRDRNNH